MKMRMWIAVVAAVALCQMVSANLLTNPGFETTDTGLPGWEQADWYVGHGSDAHSGTNGMAYWVPNGRGNGDYYVALQSVPVVGGVSYDASMWLRTVSFNTSEAFMEVVFQDSAGSWIGQSGTTPVGGSTDYTQYSLNALAAPAAAVTAMVRAVVHTTGATTDNAWYTFDDFSFDAVPEPGTFALFGLGLLGFLRLRRKMSK